MVNIPFTANTHLKQNESYDYYSQAGFSFLMFIHVYSMTVKR